MKGNRGKKAGIMILGMVVAIIVFFYFLQTYWVHRKYHYKDGKVECVHLLGFLTMEERLVEESYEIKDPQPGDILITLSTHSLGWRHGHAALVIDENTTLECVSLGTKSQLCPMTNWESYSNCALLRIKGITQKEQEDVVEYALTYLTDVDYRMYAGIFDDRDELSDTPEYGLQCSFLVWYAWTYLSYDLDSDGGWLVTSHDLLHSEKVEVIFTYGLDENLEPIQ